MEFWEPAEFRVASLKHGWTVSDLAQRWAEVAHHSGRQGSINLSEMASRLQSGYRHVQSRLGDLSEAYGLQLSAACRKRTPEEYRMFHDRNSAKVYMCISALFWEMAVLRDCLAEFYAEFVFEVSGVDSFSGLLQKVDKSSKQHDVAVMLKTIGVRGGWLNLFTEYRNFFTHVIPLEQASNLAFAIQDQITLNNGTRAAQLYYPLPADTKALRERKNKKIYYSSLEEMAIAHADKKDRSKEPDALAYLHECVDAFVELGEQALKCSPVAPSPIVITEEDIIGPIITTEIPG